MNQTKVTISTTIAAERSKVWEYYTQPKHITQWNFADPSWHCPSAENDLTVGGRYVARMEARDGSFGFDFEAFYDRIIVRQELTYTMADGRVATTTFTDMNNETSVITIFDAENENPIEMQQQGWQAILDNFKKYVESN